MYRYFVAYNWKRFFATGLGMCVIETNQNMETMHGLREVMEQIKEENRFTKCVVLNFKKLGKDDEPEE